MDFGMLAPEVNSGRMYTGPGAGPMLTAAAAWDKLAADLYSAAASYGSVISGLTRGPWLGPASISMAAAAAPYVAWLQATAAQAEHTASQARAAAAAYETAFAMTVPPPVIAANRALLMSLIATNILGQNTPAIMATQADYAEMWAQDATAMYGYAGASATASALTPFTPPPLTTSPAGLAAQGAAVAQSAATPAGAVAQTIASTGSQLLSAAPQGLQGLAQPSQAAAPSFLQLLSLFTPVNTAIASTNTAVTSSALGYAAYYDPPGASKLDTILERLGPAPVIGSGSGASASLGSAGPGTGGGATTVVSAGLSRAPSIGMLSVPPSWAAAAPAFRPIALGLPIVSAGAAPTAIAGGPESLFSQMALASLVGSGAGNAAVPLRAARANAEKSDSPNHYNRFAVETGDHIDRTAFTDIDWREEQDLRSVTLTKLEREILALVRRYTAGG